MLRIELEGARTLLAALRRIDDGQGLSEAELDIVLAANAFFVDAYSGAPGCSREAISTAIRCFDNLEDLPAGPVPTRLAEGFRQAMSQFDLMEDRLSWLQRIDSARIGQRVLEALPAETLLESTIHVTVDGFNGAFVREGDLGVSLVRGPQDPRSFDDMVCHELHHIGFDVWRARDAVRVALMEDSSARSVAVHHVDNLLAEGMANAFFTPGHVFSETSEGPNDDTYRARRARLEEEEASLFVEAESILSVSLEARADRDACRRAFRVMALDLEEAILPAAHYLGARMVQTMARHHPHARLVRCVQNLAEFLPLYNVAASREGGFVFDSATVQRFSALWEME